MERSTYKNVVVWPQLFYGNKEGKETELMVVESWTISFFYNLFYVILRRMHDFQNL